MKRSRILRHSRLNFCRVRWKFELQILVRQVCAIVLFAFVVSATQDIPYTSVQSHCQADTAILQNI